MRHHKFAQAGREARELTMRAYLRDLAKLSVVYSVIIAALIIVARLAVHR
jgi:hypothetical protein